jgi:peptidoglycan-associated lipoprotein
MKRWMSSIAVLALLAGCAATPQPEQEPARVEERKPDVAQVGPAVTPEPKPKAQPTPAPKPVEATPKPAVTEKVGVDPLRDPANILSRRSIYFDYDSNVVKEEFKPIVSAHARYLQQNRSARATIQGHTDERGSREYNLALGQRRADAVRQMMTLLGASAAQIETVSFGKEKPRALGSNEKAWAENRRADIVYQGE